MWNFWDDFTQFIGNLCAGFWIKTMIATVFALITRVFDMAHPSVQPLIWLMLIDFALGAFRALRDCRFTWQGVRKGVNKFIYISLALVVTSLADKGISIEIVGASFTGALCYYLISCQTISALTHINELSEHKLPTWLLERLEYYKKSLEEGHKPSKDKPHD